MEKVLCATGAQKQARVAIFLLDIATSSQNCLEEERLTLPADKGKNSKTILYDNCKY